MTDALASDCSKCRLRPRSEGGSGGCPFNGALLAIYAKRDDCPRYREGEFVSKRERQEAERRPQEAALF